MIGGWIDRQTESLIPAQLSQPGTTHAWGWVSVGRRPGPPEALTRHPCPHPPFRRPQTSLGIAKCPLEAQFPTSLCPKPGTAASPHRVQKGLSGRRHPPSRVIKRLRINLGSERSSFPAELFLSTGVRATRLPHVLSWPLVSSASVCVLARRPSVPFGGSERT